MAEALKAIEMEKMETINPYVLAPWEKRVHIITDGSAQKLNADWAVRIAVSSSSRKGVVGIGGVIKI